MDLRRVQDGLDGISLLPSGSGYLELGGGWREAVGGFAYGELGYKPLDRLSLFGRGEYDTINGGAAYGGVRLLW